MSKTETADIRLETLQIPAPEVLMSSPGYNELDLDMSAVASLGLAPDDFTKLVEHPWIGADKPHFFYEIPGRYDLLVRGTADTRDPELDKQKLQEQGETLNLLEKRYGIRNSGFYPVRVDGSNYVVTHIISGPSLETSMEDGNQASLEVADRLLGKLVDYSSDLIAHGGVLAGDIYGFDEYVPQDKEAVLVDLDIDAMPLPVDEKTKMIYLLDVQLGNMAKMAATLASHAGETPATGRLVSLLEGLDVPTPQMKEMVRVLIDAVEQRDTRTIVKYLFGDSEWREYVDGITPTG